MVTISGSDGRLADIMDKAEIEQSITAKNEEKYRQSSHSPFFQLPLWLEFRFKETKTAAQRVLYGCYESNYPIDTQKVDFINELSMLDTVKGLVLIHMSLTIESYRSFWKKAKENTSCFPDALSFATMKAGAFSELISEIDCRLTRITLQVGYSPKRWKKCMDVMIPKKNRKYVT